MNQRRFWLPFLLLIALATAMIAVISTPPNVPAVPIAVTAKPSTAKWQQQVLAAMEANNAAMKLDERLQERAQQRRDTESNSAIDKGIVIPWETHEQRREDPI